MPSVLFIVTIPKSIVNEDGLTIEILPIVQRSLESLKVDAAVTKDETSSGVGFQLLFQADQDQNAESIISALESIGIGHNFGSISMTDLAFSLPVENCTDSDDDSALKSSVKSRLVVRQLLHETEGASAFSFDFVLLCIMGSIIATMGLAISSPAIIVASMLVSPILGPILAIAFGSALFEWKLLRKGIEVELAGMLLCVMTGFVTGIGLAPWGYWLEFPTPEMASRGEPYSGLVIGAFIALPSGVGVGLSVLGNNMPALIGVAISASLLPPAANCGLLLAYGLVGESFHGHPVDSTAMFEMAVVSLLITILNILCIFVASILIFRVKEVMPLPDKTDLWKTFIPEVRRQNASQVYDSKLERALSSADMVQAVRPRSTSMFGEVLAAQRPPSQRYNYDEMVSAARHASLRAKSAIRSSELRHSSNPAPFQLAIDK